MHYKRPDQLRKVAILMASLDEGLAGEMLREFPPTEAAKIRELIARLGEIDPEEQSDVLEEFRHSSELQGSFKESVNDAAVEIDASLQRQMERLVNEPAADKLTTGVSTAAVSTAAVSTANNAPFAIEAQSGDQRQQVLAEAAGPTLAKLLETEHPQTIALVLSRLSERQAAETLNNLSQAKQAESIERLVHLMPAASEVVDELESQIADSIAEQRLQQEHFAAGSSLARRILELTTPAAKTAILERIGQRDKLVAESLAAPSFQATATPAESTAPTWSDQYLVPPEPSLASLSVAKPQQAYSACDRGETDVELEVASTLPGEVAEQYFPTATDPGLETAEAACEPQETYDPAVLETIDASTLAALFDAVGERATLLVLATASDLLLRRVFTQLPRREAKRLRQKIRQFGPTPLNELFAAQQQILQLADRSGVLKTIAA